MVICYNAVDTPELMAFSDGSWFFRLPDGSLMEITKVYPLDAVFDNPDDVPENVMDKFMDSLEIVHVDKFNYLCIHFFILVISCR